MVFHDVEEISCGHLEEIGVIIFGAASSLRGRKRRLQKAKIANSPSTAVPFYLVVMDFEDLFQIEEKRRQRISPRGALARDDTACSQPAEPCEMTLAASRCGQV